MICTGRMCIRLKKKNNCKLFSLKSYEHNYKV